MGFTVVAERLRMIAGKRKHKLKPLGSSGGDAGLPQTSAKGAKAAATGS
jgi:hypothetical protein